MKRGKGLPKKSAGSRKVAGKAESSFAASAGKDSRPVNEMFDMMVFEQYDATASSDEKGFDSDLDDIQLSTDDEDFLEYIQLASQYLDVQFRLLQVTAELNIKQSRVDAGELMDGEILEKRIVALENVLADLTTIVNNKDELIQQLQKKFHSEQSNKLVVHYSKQKDVCEMFKTMAALINNMENHLESFETVMSLDCTHDVKEIASVQLDSFSRLNAWLYSLGKFRSSFKRIFDLRTKPSSLTIDGGDL